MKPWIAPVLAAALGLAWAASDAVPPRPAAGEMRLEDAGELPVAHLGRVKPLDSVARTTLLVISRRQTFEDLEGRRLSALRWLMDAIGDPEAGVAHRVFRIDHPDVLHLLHLAARPGSRYAMTEFADAVPDLFKQAEAAETRRRAGEPLDAFESKALELANNVQAYMDLVQGSSVHAVPPKGGGDEWRPLSDSLQQEPPSDRDAAALRDIFEAYHRRDAAAFNGAVAAYRARLDARLPREASKARFEVRFNHAEPFYHCAVLYVFAFVLACLSWLGWAKPLGRAALSLAAATWVLHTAALVARIYISGRPPVTNLYSSAVFIGWGGVLLGFVLERLYRLGVGTVVASVVGALTLIVAHFLSLDGDTFQVLQAVLDTQFWLATHVTCVTLGYATTFVAGLLGILYVVRGALTPSLSPETARALSRMTYGVICFALLFSFVGTVLGGLWADDSWGRFWGWDPKENGALIIVLWHALVLHARWGGMVRERGLAVLAVFGNIVTCWSWFGVNLLGVGLHSYGWNPHVTQALAAAVVANLAVIAIGLTPTRRWWSVRRRPDWA